MPHPSKSIRWEVYTRKPSTDRPRALIYVRAVDIASGKTLLSKSTGLEAKSAKFNQKAARAKIAELSGTIDFNRIIASKTGGVDLQSASILAGMTLVSFFEHFWDTTKSQHLIAKADAGKALSSTYIKSQLSYVKRFANTYDEFKKTQLHEVNLFLVEKYIRHLRKIGLSGNLVGDCLNAIRTPLSWAMKRGLVDAPFNFSAIERPKETYRKRGILTRQEIIALSNLKVDETITPRPRLKKGEKHSLPGAIDLRIKAGALLSNLTALRAGEIRGLHWSSIDWENKTILIERNFVEGDGEKTPKRDSTGKIPLLNDIEETLKALRQLAFKLGKYQTDGYVFFSLGEKNRPMSIKALEAGYARALEWIGISREIQKERRLVLHGGRHFSSTILDEKLGHSSARKVTRHRTEQTFIKYADHETIEAIEAARNVMEELLKQKLDVN